MMADKKQLALGLLAGAVIGGATLGTIGVSAQTGSNGVADRLAERFGVESSEVQAELDTIKEEKQVERQAEKEAFVQSKVDDGTITAEQKTLLEEKRAELKTSKEDLKDSDLTREEMRELKETSKEEFKAWAEENGIDLEALRDGAPEKGRRGHRGGNGFGGDKSAEDVEVAPTSVQ